MPASRRRWPGGRRKPRGAEPARPSGRPGSTGKRSLCASSPGFSAPKIRGLYSIGEKEAQTFTDAGGVLARFWWIPANARARPSGGPQQARRLLPEAVQVDPGGAAVQVYAQLAGGLPEGTVGVQP